jgi:hypothetical protein
LIKKAGCLVIEDSESLYYCIQDSCKKYKNESKCKQDSSCYFNTTISNSYGGVWQLSKYGFLLCLIILNKIKK